MKELLTQTALLTLSFLALGFVSDWAGSWIDDRGYKNGQVDCMNGRIEYEIHQNKDGTTSWEKKISKKEMK